MLATDNDIGVNAQITYDLPPGDEFTINPQTGAITTSISSLDREEREFYNITVQARDGGGRVGTAMLSITITDINDKRPTFLADTQMLNLDRTLMENFTVGGHIVDVIATDDDIGVNAQLTYTITNGEGYFQISSSGAITLAQSMLPEEGLGPFELTVTATDGGIPAMSDSFEVDITITDVNDNAPIITQAPQMVHVAEDFTVGDIILDALFTMPIQATDRDQGTNAEIEFILEPLSPFFGIDFVNGQVQINLTAPLDRETVAQHTISVVARDKGTPQLSSAPSVITFIVDDVNDNPPIFSQDLYAANVSEFTGPGVPVLLLIASDNDTGK